MRIRTGENSDIAAIRAAGLTFNNRIHPEHVVVAEDDDGEIVGFAKCFRSGLHRSRYWATVRVKDTARLQGVGRSLLQELGKRRNEKLPFAAKMREDDPGLEFIRRIGGRPYQVSPGMRLDLTGAATIEWLQGLPSGSDVDAEILPGTAFGAEDLVETWCDMYTWTHEEWAPVNSRADVSRVFADEVRIDLLRNKSMFARRDGEIVAGVFVFVTPRQEPLDAVAETRARDIDGVYLAACVRESALAAVERGWKELSFDGHRDDPHLAPLLATAPRVFGTALYLMEYDPEEV